MNTPLNGDDLRWHRGEGDALEANQDVVERISRLIKAKERERLWAILDRWPSADVMALFLALPLKRARKLFEWRDRDRETVKVIALLNPDLRTALLKDASITRIVKVLDRMEPEQALQDLEDLPEDVAQQVLPRLNARATIEELRAHGEDSAGSLMSRKFVAVPDDWTIGMVTAEILANAQRIEKLYGVSVVDANRRPVGYLKLRDLLLLPPEAGVRAAMHTDFIAVTPDMDQEEVARLADSYELNVMPVVDADGHLVGRITPDRLRQVIRDEAEEDIKIMAGLATDTQPDESVRRIVRGRAPWLLVGLVGASLSGVVVGAYEEQLAQAAILASFIPIVMSTAGNAGIQASTVAVQGLATGTLTFADLGWRLGKELTGALANGLIAALALVLLAFLLSQLGEIQVPLRLLVTAGLAEMTVVIAAVAVGATVPVVLDRLGIDPAMATGVFITTGNDILAVLIFFVTVTLFYFV
ncbi:MAG: magnesium transporter [Candidatus Thiosymbion ectosymbiont of Robbea hypermnestra]|nr:magnesium transporter [Candidatus Thiosymbion ectosymbiont of Robbea hypermnestra]